MRYIVLLCGFVVGCANNQQPVPSIDPDILNSISICSAGASAKMGFDIAAAAKRNLEKTGYEGTFGTALTQEVAGMIMKVNISDAQRLELFKEYQKCIAVRDAQ